MKIAVQMDHVSKLNIKSDTTLALCLEANQKHTSTGSDAWGCGEEEGRGRERQAATRSTSSQVLSPSPQPRSDHGV